MKRTSQNHNISFEKRFGSPLWPASQAGRLWYDALQPQERKAWAVRQSRERGQGLLHGRPQGLTRTSKSSSAPALAVADPCLGLPTHTLKCSWPHFLRPWEAAGMRKSRGTQGGSGPAQALTICTSHTASVQPAAQTVGGFSFSPSFGAFSSLTLNK